MARKKTEKGKGLNPKEKKQVKKMIHSAAESKFFSVTAVSTNYSNTPFVAHISPITQGDGDQQRNGDRIRMKYIQFRLFNVIGLSSSTQYHFGRFILFQWLPNNTNYAPTSGDILLPGVSNTINYTSLYNHDQRQNYRILYDKTFKFVGVPATTGAEFQDSAAQFTKDMYIKVKSKQLNYTTGVNTGTRQIFQLVLGDGIGADTAQCFWTMKMFYDDI